MTYVNALTVFINRLGIKHYKKGFSFKDCSEEYLHNGLLDEVDEYKEATTPQDKITELTDIMVSCTILIERIMQGTEEVKEVNNFYWRSGGVRG